MPAVSSVSAMSALSRVRALLCAASICIVCVVGAAMRPAAALDAADITLEVGPAPGSPAPLMIAPGPTVQPPVTDEPFGLTAVNSGPMAAKWRSLQPAIHLERQIIAGCREDAMACTPAVRRMLAVVDAARGRASRARVGAINRAVNLAIKPQSDPARFGATDVWSTPLMTFTAGAGDCEDYAIAKYVALREAGMSDEDLRLVVVHDRRLKQDHAVLAARVDDEWLILDNRHMVLLSDAQLPHMSPLIAFEGDGTAPFTVAGAPAARDMVPATY